MSKHHHSTVAGRIKAGTLGVLTLLLLASPTHAAGQNSHLLLIGGLGGDPEYTESFHTWISRFADAAMESYGIPAERIIYLGEKTSLDPTRIANKSTADNIRAAFMELGSQMAPDDELVVFMAGHGTFRDNETRFNIPGPDLTPGDFAMLLAPLGDRHITFINTATASGPFVEALSGEHRTIITATKSGRELNLTSFGLHFVDAFSGDGADLDKNSRVSMLEAYTYARAEVVREYESDNQILTEHSMLDDNGDGEGSSEPPAGGEEGTLAGATFLISDAAGPSVAGASPALQALFRERAAIEERVVDLRNIKAQLSQEAYEDQLEDLLVALALKAREIREAEST